ncbi:MULTISPECIES: DMT family transporter [unclassified Xanthobacter]|uniref:DMT family transporter n=1 Tax=unclassified Xanthobacter TaxID=2623496 RepID=UPI001EDEB0AC|nr:MULTISPECIES: DMT family transporter [unclassified Xanthobacter]
MTTDATASMARRETLLPLLCLLATGALLGLTTFVAGSAIRQGWAPFAFLFWSALTSGVLLSVLALAAGERPRLSPHLLRYALLSGLLSFALPNLLSFAAIPHVGAGFVALCLAFPPLVTYAMAVPLRMDRLTTRGVLGMALGLVGAVFLALSGTRSDDGGWLWIGLALAAPLVVSAGNIYRTVDWPGLASPRLLAPLMLLAAALISGTVAVATGVPLQLPDAPVEIALLAAQTLVVAATYALYFILQKLSGPVGLSQIGWIAAGTGKTLAVAFLGETVPLLLPPAFVLILAGIIVLARRGKGAGADRRD